MTTDQANHKIEPSVQLTLPRNIFEQGLNDLLMEPQSILYGQPGRVKRKEGVEFLINKLSSRPNEQQPNLVFWLVERMPDALNLKQQLAQSSKQYGIQFCAWVALMRDGAWSGSLLLESKGWIPVSEILLTGSGMIKLHRGSAEKLFLPKQRQRYERLIGALSPSSWERLTQLKIAIVGLGRSGSLINKTLTMSGISSLSLIDHDHIEIHNLDAMEDVLAGDIGRYKVDALADHIKKYHETWQSVRPFSCRAESSTGIEALTQNDLWVSCVDHDGSRLAIGVLAHLYGRPLLDIGSGIIREKTGLQQGGDIRLILPGEQRCVVCFGGVNNLRQALSLTGKYPDDPRSWDQLRSGSLRSLNQIVVHLGVRMLEDLIDERINSSQWKQYDESNGQTQIQALEPAHDPMCPLCAEPALGDLSLPELPKITERVVYYLNSKRLQEA